MKRFGWTLVLVSILVGCGRKEQPPATPNLSAPEKPSASGTVPGTSTQLPAEAEVTASSGPVQLTLRIYKTTIKARKDFLQPFEDDKHLLYQIELKNIGKNRFLVTDDEMFRVPGAYIVCESTTRFGTCIDVLGPDGKHPYFSALYFAADNHPFDYGILPEPDDKEGLALKATWEKAGLTIQEIGSRFLERARRMLKEPPLEEKRPDPPLWLAPGASTSTLAWVHRDRVELINGKPMRAPVGQFSELDVLNSSKPGKYRIRAVYNHEHQPEMVRKYELRVYEDDVRVATPYIEFEVVP